MMRGKTERKNLRSERIVQVGQWQKWLSVFLPLVLLGAVFGMASTNHDTDQLATGKELNVSQAGIFRKNKQTPEPRTASRRIRLFNRENLPVSPVIRRQMEEQERQVRGGSRNTRKVPASPKVAAASPLQKNVLSISRNSAPEVTIARSSMTYDKIQLGLRKPTFKYLTPEVRRQIDAAKISKGRWRYVVIHNSATSKGSASAFDRYHRNVRGMSNGMAYHFIIGNGSYTGNGQIEVGNRWKNQIQGGHLKSLSQNQVSIGICLVGDFDSQKVRDAQLEALDELTNYLQVKAGSMMVTTHRRINIVPTTCPGRYFPDQQVMAAFNR